MMGNPRFENVVPPSHIVVGAERLLQLLLPVIAKHLSHSPNSSAAPLEFALFM